LLQLDAIRELYTHHETRRDILREEHSDIYAEFERVKQKLDSLSTELHMLTEHGVALDANFSKYGYDAHLRTTDADSSVSSLFGDHAYSHGSRDWAADRRNVEVMKFWRRPVVRQYFHKGLLWRSGRSGETAAFELFADLLYVGIIGIIGDTAVEEPTGHAFVQFLVTFIIGWKMWGDLTCWMNWFEIDDIVQRVSVLFYVVCLFGYAVNLSSSSDTTYASMIGFYLAARLFAGTYYIYTAICLPNVRGTMIGYAIIVAIASALWIGSIHVPYPDRLGLIFPAICIDQFAPMIMIWLVRTNKTGEGGIREKLAKHFDFYPAMNIEHRVERTNAFVTLVFGYSVLTILFQTHSSIPVNAFYGKAVLGLIQAFAFNWIYFEVDADRLHLHAIRRHYISALVWVSVHIPFIMGYVLAAAAMGKLVLAHDCADAELEMLTETYQPRSEVEIGEGVRWYYCGGLGVALLGMAAISYSHVHKKVPNARIKKKTRLAVRVCAAIIIICLPLAHSLTSLDLMALTTSLVLLVLGFDIFGISETGDKFWTGGFCDEEKKKCTYSAQCPLDKKRRTELDRAMKRGDRVQIDDLLRMMRKDSATATTSEVSSIMEKGQYEGYGGGGL
jgi:low temperature requirement protein LtrA